MKTFAVDGVVLEVSEGDIASQPDIDAVVNAANAQLQIGGGVAGAIHRGAGPGLTEETRQYAPIEPGEAVITGAHNLPNDYVVHCLGPRWGIDRPEARLLASCYEQALKLADQEGIESIAFPAISTGAFGYPFEEATTVVLDTVLPMLEDLAQVKRIRFVLFSTREREFYEQKLMDRL